MDIAIPFVTTIVQKIAESTIAKVGCQVGYLIQYKTNIQNLHSELENLSDNKVRMQRSIDEEERKGNKRIHDDVKKWLSEVDEISEVVNKFFEDERQPKKCFHGVFPNLMLRYKQSRTVTELEKRVVDLIHKKEEFPTISYTTLPRVVLSTKEDYTAFKSRALTVNKIIDELTSPNSNKIGVYGLGGVGKTTLVNEVARIATEKKLFGEVVLVEVKQIPDVNRVQKEIAESLGLELDEDKLSLAGRAKRLYERIKNDKVLIILDDIWEVLDLETVGIPVGFCKILMTSRSLEVLKNKMLTEKEFVLEVLDDEETWSLFAKMVGDDVLQDPQIQGVARNVAKICGGLPVLIIAVASALRRNKSLPSWKDALRKLKKFDKEGYQQKAYSALEWSFNQLGDEEAKNLFLLCGMHGGKAVLLTDLLKYTMGLHMFKDVKTIEETRDRLYALVDKLKSNCLFMLTGDGANERVEMHDLTREASLLIVEKYHNVLSLSYGEEFSEWPNEDELERNTMICLAGRKIPKLPEGMRCTKLQMFLSKLSDDELLEIPYNFFKEMKELKVLDLSNFWFRRSSLPSLNFVINLRTLCLHQCVLGDIASVGELSNLEILSLFRSRIYQLPKEIGNLARLRMLDISHCTELKVIAPNVLSRLTRLEELNMEDSFKQWEPERVIDGGESRNANLSELKHLSELTSLKIHIPNAKDLPTTLFSDKLERYFIIIGDVWDWNVINENASKVLKLKLDDSIQYLDESLQMVMKRSESLYLDVLEGVYDIPNQLNREGFPLLKHLQIQNDDKIMYIIDSMEWGCSDNTLPILESLFLYKLDSLEGVFCGQLGANSFGQLRSIKVESCTRLKNLFTVSVAGHLSHLENMEVVSCNFLEEIVDHQVANDPVEFLQLKTLTLRNLPNLLGFSSNGSVPINSTRRATTQLFNGKVVFPKLEVLKLSSIPLNNILWDDKVSERLSWITNLTMLCVDDCDGLRSLCSSSMAINFVQLKWLEISSCQHMVEIILTEEYNNNGEVKNVDGMFQKLETLKLEGLANLENFCTSATYIEFPCLKFLTIQNCTSLGSFTVDPMMSRNVNRSDTAVHYLFDEKVGFPQLEELIIEGLDKLTTIWHAQLAPDSFCKLIEFSVEYCSSLIHVLVPHILERLHILNKLFVSHCESVQAVFIVNEGRDGEDRHDHPYYSEILTCRNLASVSIYSCTSLKTVFPAPVARVLEKLKWLDIMGCKRLEEIVSKDKLEAKIILMSPKFVFPCAQYVMLVNLPELTSFYPGMHTSMWPSLKKLMVHGCHKFEILAQVCSSSQRQQHVRHDDQLGIPTKQPFFLSEKGSFSRLEEIFIELNDSLCGSVLPTEFSKIKTLSIGCGGITLDFVSVFLKKFHSLQSLTFCASTMEEIFVNDGEEPHVFMQLKSLEVYGLLRLRHVWKENSHLAFGTSSVFPNLENFRVAGCGRLKNIVSSAIPFCNIVRLEVVDCHGLKHLITCSVAKSLVQLQSIIVEDCERLVEIVASSDDNNNIDGAARNEITFSRLKLLKLSNLPNLKGFCSRNYNVKFPLLTTLSVISCIEMRISDDGLLLNDSKHDGLLQITEEEEEEEEE